MLHFLPLNAPKMRLVAGLRSDPLGDFTALPQTPIAELRGRGGEWEKGRGSRKGKEEAVGRNGRTPCLKCVDANVYSYVLRYVMYYCDSDLSIIMIFRPSSIALYSSIKHFSTSVSQSIQFVHLEHCKIVSRSLEIDMVTERGR